MIEAALTPEHADQTPIMWTPPLKTKKPKGPKLIKTAPWDDPCVYPMIVRSYRSLSNRDHRIIPRSPLPFTLAEYRDFVLDSLGTCPICLGPLALDNFSPDHDLALSRGGTDDISNLQIICWSCNSLKKDQGVDWVIRTLIARSYGRPDPPKFDYAPSDEDELPEELI